MKVSIFPIVIILLLCITFFDRQPAQADCRSFSSLIDNGGYALADRTGRVIMSCNEDKQFIPASIVKIPLALAAFDILGPQFRFTTNFYLDYDNNLYIKGSGDPFLVSEEVSLIVDRLFQTGIREVNGIFVDNSNYQLSLHTPGGGGSDNPYDVPVTAVAVNFNTVNVRVQADGTVESAEPQTPTVPLMLELGSALSPGVHRLNICQKGCDADVQSSRYVAELFQAFLQLKGVTVQGTHGLRPVPVSFPPVYTHRNSKQLQDIVFSFLKYSNNFVANQVFLRGGVERYGGPATWEKGAKAYAASLQEIIGNEYAAQIIMKDGAGLSRENRATPLALLKVLEKFKPFASLLQEKKDIRVKSGTLDGVYNYGGYLADDKAFVIVLNQKRNTRDAIMRRLQSK